VHLRPRLLLQLQQLVPNQRSVPSIDVLPSTQIAGTALAPRLARKFPRMFGIKGQLGISDVLLVKSEDYNSQPSELSENDEDEKTLDQRELIAIISPVQQRHREAGGEIEITLADGAVWHSRIGPNESYDFVHTDNSGHSTTARWVRRTTKPKSCSQSTSSRESQHFASVGNGEYKYTFSVLNPESRRHPIMATLTPASLDILDSYTTVSASSGRFPPTKPFPTNIDLVGGDVPTSPISVSSSATGTRRTIPVDSAARILITATAVWVTLQQQNNPTSVSQIPVHHGQKQGSLSPEVPASPVSTPKPRRTMSTGAAFMHRKLERDKLAAESLVDHDGPSESHDEGFDDLVGLRRRIHRRLKLAIGRIGLGK
jgi:hypothetical protein